MDISFDFIHYMFWDVDTDVIETVKTSRNLDKKIANYRVIHFNIPREIEKPSEFKEIEGHFYIGGGAALALQSGHRLSNDLGLLKETKYLLC